MFNIFTKNKQKFCINFIEEVKQSSPAYFSLDLRDDSLTTTWRQESGEVLGIKITDSEHILTNTLGKSIKIEANKTLTDTLLMETQRVLLSKIEEAKKIIHLFPNIDAPQEGELKGEEWLKVTNHVLKESLKKAATDESLLVEAKLFIGLKNKESENFNIRLQCYNLDYSLSFLQNGKLFLSVFDDKNFERGFSEKPSYSGEFYNNRPVILNEFIILVHDIFSRGKIKIFE